MHDASEEPPPPLDATAIVETLNRHRVDYVVIGGVALQAHGHVRTTYDLDVIAAWTPQNMRRLAAALGELGAQLRGVDGHLLEIDPDDPDHLYRGGNFLMRTPHGDLDVFAADQTAGAPRSYELLRRRAMGVDVRGLPFPVAGVEDLIRMKHASAAFRDRAERKRQQDLDDVAVLSRLLRERQNSAGLEP